MQPQSNATDGTGLKQQDRARAVCQFTSSQEMAMQSRQTPYPEKHGTKTKNED
jgi:hypothetical protein